MAEPTTTAVAPSWRARWASLGAVMWPSMRTGIVKCVVRDWIKGHDGVRMPAVSAVYP